LPSQTEIKWSQLKVGMLVVSGIAALIVLIFLMSNSTGGLFTRKIKLRSYFENANGLKVGAPVTLDGVTIGNVTQVRIVPHHEPNSVEVVCRVGAQYLPSLHTDSEMAISQAGVLGDSFADISSTTATGPQPADNAVLGVSTTPGIEDVVRTSKYSIDEATKLIRKIGVTIDLLNSGKGTIGVLMTDPVVAKKLMTTIDQLQTITSQISNGKGTLGKLITDDSFYDKANSTMTKLDDIAAHLDNGEGTAGKFLKDDSLYNNLNAAIDNANHLLADVNSGKGSLGRLAKDPAFAHQVEESVTRLNELLKGLNEGKGTLGQLVINRSLYDNADDVLKQGSALLVGVRQDPKKYLSIKLKVF
jgi:phospholipid/cholesterol/gamma-HCH transport system substrate-binding protein